MFGKVLMMVRRFTKPDHHDFHASSGMASAMGLATNPSISRVGCPALTRAKCCLLHLSVKHDTRDRFQRPDQL